MPDFLFDERVRREDAVLGHTLLAIPQGNELLPLSRSETESASLRFPTVP